MSKIWKNTTHPKFSDTYIEVLKTLDYSLHKTTLWLKLIEFSFPHSPSITITLDLHIVLSSLLIIR